MDKWLDAAVDYLPQWLDYQIQRTRQTGCLMAVVLERAFGTANSRTGEALTPRHRFRIASHSKTFTATGILKLREQGRLRLDDPIGQFVKGLDRRTAAVTIAQLLSHGAGLTRDGRDAGQFAGRRPYLDEKELRADLAAGPVIESGLRLKYSNHGYALLGLAIAAITGQPYASWIAREVVAAAGLKETTPDMPLKRGTPFARGHSDTLLGGDRRVVIAGDYNERAIAPAGGFVSTAADTALFFNQLAPKARRSLLSPASRREMVRPQWRNPHSSLESYYGLGTMSGSVSGWNWFGHAGGLLGYVSRTVTLPDHDVTLSIFSNCADGWAGLWVDGAVNVLRTFAQNGPPARRLANWAGRWWTEWGGFDIVPMGGKLFLASPAFANHPFFDSSAAEPTGRDTARITLAPGYANQGETIRRVRNVAGRVTEVWVGGARCFSRARAAAELKRNAR